MRLKVSTSITVMATVALAVAIPLAWHLLGCDKDGSTDYLAYVGALLGALATIAAVILEIRSSSESRREEHEQATRPVVWVGIDPDYQFRNALEDIEVREDRQTRLERHERNLAADHAYDVKTYGRCLILERKGGEIKRTHLKEIDESLSKEAHDWTYWKGEGGGLSIGGGSYLAIPLIIKNVGNGPALNLVVGTMLPNEDFGYHDNLPATVLGVGDTTYFLICVNHRSGWEQDERFFVTATYDTLTGQCFRSSSEIILHVDKRDNYITNYWFKFIPTVDRIEREEEPDVQDLAPVVD